MKSILRFFMAGTMALAMIGFASCEKEKVTPAGDTTDPTGPQPYATLDGTEWEGEFYTSTQTQYGSYPVTIHWTVDFIRDGEGEVMFWQQSQAYDPDQYSWKMTYTYDGNNGGVISDGHGEWPIEGESQWPYTVDPVNRTLQVMLQFDVQHVQDGPIITYGGLTTLHQVR